MIPKVISEQDLNIMTNNVSMEEVKKVVFSFGAYKTLGLDGFPPTLFQTYWDIVKYDIHNAARDFFRLGRLLNQLNSTFISLIPKNDDASYLKDLKPISLCNTIYKIFSKILVFMLKAILGKVIAPN